MRGCLHQRKNSLCCNSVKQGSWPHKQLLSSRYPQLLRTNYALYVQRHTQTRFDNAVITWEQLQEQITMFKSLKSSWTNHPLLQDDFCKTLRKENKRWCQPQITHVQEPEHSQTLKPGKEQCDKEDKDKSKMQLALQREKSGSFIMTWSVIPPWQVWGPNAMQMRNICNIYAHLLLKQASHSQYLSQQFLVGSEQ